MRWMLACLGLLVLAPGGVAHGDAPAGLLNHTQLAETALAPGQQHAWIMAYAGQPLPAHWHVLLHVEVQATGTSNGGMPADVQVQMTLSLDEELGNWSLGSGIHTQRLLLGQTGTPVVEMTNLGGVEASVRWYYDHTCDCSAKIVPIPGPIWLNVDAERGERVVFDLQYQPMQTRIDGTPMPDHVEVRATQLLAGYAPGAQVVGDHDLSADEPCERAMRWNGCLRLEFTAPRDGMQLVWVEARTDAATWAVAVQPVVEVTQKQAPWPAIAAVVLVGLAAYRRAT